MYAHIALLVIYTISGLLYAFDDLNLAIGSIYFVCRFIVDFFIACMIYVFAKKPTKTGLSRTSQTHENIVKVEI